jgi:hypothetical protein
MARPVRIGAVTYLNSRPLVYELESLAPEAELVLMYPVAWRITWPRGALTWRSSP